MAFGAKKDTTSAEVKSIELSLKQVEESKKNMIYQLGELYYESKKLEYNCKVWNNRKLKTQGLRMCENCGNTLPYDSSFCNKCGYKLQAVSEELVII